MRILSLSWVKTTSNTGCNRAVEMVSPETIVWVVGLLLRSSKRPTTHLSGGHLFVARTAYAGETTHADACQVILVEQSAQWGHPWECEGTRFPHTPHQNGLAHTCVHVPPVCTLRVQKGCEGTASPRAPLLTGHHPLSHHPHRYDRYGSAPQKQRSPGFYGILVTGSHQLAKRKFDGTTSPTYLASWTGRQ
jgi:hypothetical protein